jgi:hypothetical protein
MTTLFFDIQTIPSQDQAIIQQITLDIKPPANYKQTNSINLWYQENLKTEVAKRYQQTALDGRYGEVFSIAWAVDDEPVTVFWRDELSSERGLLENFMNEMAHLEDQLGQRRYLHKWVGHYISGFDLRFFWQRCVINQVKPSIIIPLDAKPWDERIFDTQLMWSGNSPANKQSADFHSLTQVLGLQNPLELTGKQVYQAWLAGRYESIAEYNRQVVNHSRELYKRMLFMHDDGDFAGQSK